MLLSQTDSPPNGATRINSVNLLAMKKWIAAAVLVILLGAGVFLFLRSRQEDAPTGDPETRIVIYLQKNVRPGQPVLVTELYNKVFTRPEERDALQHLYDTVFKIPAFSVEFFMKNGKAPTLKELSDQFQLKIPGETEALLRVLDSDPRMPRFFDRDAATGEITRVYVDRITADEKFGKPLRNH
jgi:hypothetical protein